MFPESRRKLLMVCLLAALATQTLLVYTDDTGRQGPPLSPLAQEGRALWHQNACVTCHQFYGFGGFLGPDLTNAMARLDRTRLDSVLTEGPKQMPDFGMSTEQIDALEAFLRAMNETGIGQARQTEPASSAQLRDALARLAATGELPAQEARGAIWRGGFCAACHVPLQANPLGRFVALDLSRAASRLDEEQLRRVLLEGRPDRGMPMPPLTEADREDVLAYLRWSSENRETLAAELGMSERADFPWWEF